MSAEIIQFPAREKPMPGITDIKASVSGWRFPATGSEGRCLSLTNSTGTKFELTMRVSSAYAAGHDFLIAGKTINGTIESLAFALDDAGLRMIHDEIQRYFVLKAERHEAGELAETNGSL